MVPTPHRHGRASEPRPEQFQVEAEQVLTPAAYFGVHRGEPAEKRPRRPAGGQHPVVQLDHDQGKPAGPGGVVAEQFRLGALDVDLAHQRP
ncbi:MAG: hypothetical protein ACK559_42180, partial [bacterium]